MTKPSGKTNTERAGVRVKAMVTRRADTAISLEAIAANVKGVGVHCTLALWLASRSQQDRDTFKQAITNLHYSCPAIYKELRRHGYVGSDGVLQRHRREGCKSCRIDPVS